MFIVITFFLKMLFMCILASITVLHTYREEVALRTLEL